MTRTKTGVGRTGVDRHRSPRGFELKLNPTRPSCASQPFPDVPHEVHEDNRLASRTYVDAEAKGTALPFSTQIAIFGRARGARGGEIMQMTGSIEIILDALVNSE